MRTQFQYEADPASALPCRSSAERWRGGYATRLDSLHFDAFVKSVGRFTRNSPKRSGSFDSTVPRRAVWKRCSLQRAVHEAGTFVGFRDSRDDENRTGEDLGENQMAGAWSATRRAYCISYQTMSAMPHGQGSWSWSRSRSRSGSWPVNFAWRITQVTGGPIAARPVRG